MRPCPIPTVAFNLYRKPDRLGRLAYSSPKLALSRSCHELTSFVNDAGHVIRVHVALALEPARFDAPCLLQAAAYPIVGNFLRHGSHFPFNVSLPALSCMLLRHLHAFVQCQPAYNMWSAYPPDPAFGVMLVALELLHKTMLLRLGPLWIVWPIPAGGGQHFRTISTNVVLEKAADNAPRFQALMQPTCPPIKQPDGALLQHVQRWRACARRLVLSAVSRLPLLVLSASAPW